MAKNKTRTQIDREIDAFIAKSTRVRKKLRGIKDLAARAPLHVQLAKLDRHVMQRRPAPPKYPIGTGIWRKLDD